MTQESTHIANVIDVADRQDKQVRCDAAAKQVLSNKDILAIILREVVPEFRNCDKDFIKRECLKDGVRVDKTPPDGDDAAECIVGLNTDDVMLLEGRRSFDLLFEVQVPEANGKPSGRKKRQGAQNAAASGTEDASSSGEPEKAVLMVNLEIQQNTSPDYPLVKRMFYYMCRVVVKQKLLVENFSYSKLRKVYSIWICPNPGNEKDNFAETLNLGSESERRKMFINKRDYDLMEAIVIHVPNDFTDNDEPIIKMLSALFSRQKTVDERKKILENEFGVAMTKNLGEGIDTMCNMGEALFEEGKAEGKIEGKEEGIVTTLLRAIVSIVKHYGVTTEQAMANLGIPENEYDKYNKLLEKEGLALT